jgi:hypothetical protein
MKRSLTSTFRCERPPRPLSRPPLLTRRGILCPAILLTLVLSTAAVAVDGPCVIPGRGHFYIHVGTGGLFGAFAHDHLIEAQRRAQKTAQRSKQQWKRKFSAYPNTRKSPSNLPDLTAAVRRCTSRSRKSHGPWENPTRHRAANTYTPR